ncbi:MAG TPA: glycosyltransferase family 2 protein [Acidimicrobiia bacterium]|nr:glycosyltransferase family 2 protein [Acidimicrobiia bacterium]
MPATPVVLFLPARDEAESVGAVLARVPAEVHGHPVVALVVDDGSTDGTAEIAIAAGARVVRLDPGRGLGAAVRAGLDAAVRLDAAAVAFCDADGEYAPEELARLLAPVLDGSADYVVGSRFAGHIDRMRPHRRVGNRLLTLLVRRLSGVHVTDGQSGYRALSPIAARDAQIAHDYNYAQVLTVDLVARGYRYREVPISYSFRTTGRSFVRLVPYLRHVVPTLWRQQRELRSRAHVDRRAPALAR